MYMYVKLKFYKITLISNVTKKIDFHIHSEFI